MIHRFPVFAVLANEVETGKPAVIGASPEADVANEIASQTKALFRSVLAIPNLSDEDSEKAIAGLRSVGVMQGILVVNDEKGVVDADDVTVAG